MDGQGQQVRVTVKWFNAGGCFVEAAACTTARGPDLHALLAAWSDRPLTAEIGIKPVDPKHWEQAQAVADAGEGAEVAVLRPRESEQLEELEEAERYARIVNAPLSPAAATAIGAMFAAGKVPHRRVRMSERRG